MKGAGHLDRKEDEAKAKRSFAWLPEHMPGVAALMASRRAEYGDAHITECWRRSVQQLEPGWLYAREGPLALGTPWPDCGDLYVTTPCRPALLWIRRPEGHTSSELTWSSDAKAFHVDPAHG
jgi:hypothetical protein